MKPTIYNKFLVLGVCALAFSSANAATTTITSPGGDLVARIQDAGYFATSSPALQWNTTEFVAIDIPSSWYVLSAGGTDYTAYSNTGSNPLGTTVLSSGSSVVTTGNATGLVITQTARAFDDYLDIAVTISNTTASAISGVQWSVGFDPDQGGSGNNKTTNQILQQGSGAEVRAADWNYGTGVAISMKDVTSALTGSVMAFVGNSTGCCAPVTAASIFAANQSVGYYGWLDSSIALAYDLGTLAASGASGSAVTFGYQYNFTTPVPEPEIYAMMGIGLALMGFVARRRNAS